eukprot:1159267-Pelagomonas_calceolata.AAC.1
MSQKHKRRPTAVCGSPPSTPAQPPHSSRQSQTWMACSPSSQPAAALRVGAAAAAAAAAARVRMPKTAQAQEQDLSPAGLSILAAATPPPPPSPPPPTTTAPTEQRTGAAAAAAAAFPQSYPQTPPTPTPPAPPASPATLRTAAGPHLWHPLSVPASSHARCRAQLQDQPLSAAPPPP